MREAFGAVSMLRIFIVIFVVFISFICVAAVFGKAFRVKNYIIDAIEQYEECNIVDNMCSNLNDVLQAYFDRMDYGSIYKVREVEVNNNQRYYVVYTYTNWDIPFLGKNEWTISGRTRLISDRNLTE